MKEVLMPVDFDAVSIGEFLGAEIAAHRRSLGDIGEMFPGGAEANISRIYFGQETCERLMPSTADIGEAVRICREKKWGLSLVLPYVGPFGAKRIRLLKPILVAAADVLGSLEVVVQDIAGFSIISKIAKEDSRIVPGLGRLFSRNKRDPRFHPDDTIQIKGDESSEMEALRRNSFEVAGYADFFKQAGARRFGIDALPQGIDVSRVKKLAVDVYWPWIYVTSGRACKTASVIDREWSVYPKEAPCGTPCRRMHIEFSKPTHFYSMTKGNAVWMEVREIRDISGKIGRLIYEPYIPA